MKNNATIFFLLLSAFAYSQNKNLDYKRAIKFYNLSTYQKTTSNSSDSVFTYNSYSSNFQILHPTIAFCWKAKNQNSNEVELTGLLVKKTNSNSSIATTSSNLPPNTVSGADVFSSSISLRYEYIINYFKKSDCSLAPSLGCAINPYLDQTKQKPQTTQSFPSSYITAGVRGFITPRLTYYYSSKCFFDLNIPIALFDAQNKYSTVRNPGIRVANQRISEANFDVFPKQFYLRLGVGIKI
jgi:hypothetical protein